MSADNLLGIFGSLLPILHVQMHTAQQQIDRCQVCPIDRFLLCLYLSESFLGSLQVTQNQIVGLLHRVAGVLDVYHFRIGFQWHSQVGACRRRVVRLSVQIDEEEIVVCPQEMSLAGHLCCSFYFCIFVLWHFVDAEKHVVGNIDALINLRPSGILSGKTRVGLVDTHTLLPGVIAKLGRMVVIVGTRTVVCAVVFFHLVGNQMQELGIVGLIIESVSPLSTQIAVADEQLVKVFP